MTSFVGATDVLQLAIETRNENGIVSVALRGEADFATTDRLEATLSQVEAGGARAIQLDLTELEFADVATLRVLMQFARRTRSNGHRVTSVGAKPVLRKVARLLGGEEMLGLA